MLLLGTYCVFIGLIRVIGFDHRKPVPSKISSDHDCQRNLTFYVDLEKSSSIAVYEYFSAKLKETKTSDASTSATVLQLFLINW